MSAREQALDQLRAEMAAKAAETLGVVLPHTPEVETLARQVVNAITVGWSATKNEDYFRDTAGHVLDGSNLLKHGPGVGEPVEHVHGVRFEVITPFRELNADEAAERDRRRLASRWVYGDHKTPPPPGVSVLDLLDQQKWWVTKDGKAMRLREMSPGHRANLLALLERKAVELRKTENWRYITADAPDEVVDAAIAEEVAPDERKRKQARKWLHQQPLVKRLRALVKADATLAEDDDED
ncbi:MAG: hypothetical protein HOY78_02240 [Saccharothrix sp.]|nr:hypothetical protein [Saccharothrix sp.]